MDQTNEFARPSKRVRLTELEDELLPNCGAMTSGSGDPFGAGHEMEINLMIDLSIPQCGFEETFAPNDTVETGQECSGQTIPIPGCLESMDYIFNDFEPRLDSLEVDCNVIGDIGARAAETVCFGMVRCQSNQNCEMLKFTRSAALRLRMR
jgi:hypothetical protein